MKTLNSIIKFSVVFTLSAAFIGCSVRDASIAPVKAPVEDNSPIRTSKARDKAKSVEAGIQKLNSLNSAVYALQITQLEIPEDIFNNSVAPLAEILLDPDIYQNTEVTNSPSFFSLLTTFNSGIEKLSKLSDDALKAIGVSDGLTAVLLRYKKVIYFDCSLDLSGNCPNTKIYGRESRFPVVLSEIADREPNVFEYFRLLYSAYDKDNQSSINQGLNYKFIDRSQEFAQSIMDKEHSTSEKLSAIRKLARTLQNVLLVFDPEAMTDGQMQVLFKHFNKWDVSRRIKGLAAVGVDQVLKWLGRDLYEDKERTKLKSDFVEKVRLILNGDKEAYGLGIQTIYNRINTSNSKGLLSNFAIRPDFTPNEYWYLLDRIYYEHFSIEDAVTFWNATAKDKAKLFEALNAFVRLQMANLIVMSNTDMNKYFENKSDSFSDFLKLLLDAMTIIDKREVWTNGLFRMGHLTQFVAREFLTTELALLPDGDEYKEYAKSVQSLQTNIKMLAVYPNMMMLVYLTAKKNIIATIQTPWGPFTITPNLIIKLFFLSDETMAPWFSFGTDGQPLSSMELLYSIHFAMVTETFSTFRKNPVLPVREDEFFQEIIYRALSDNVIDMEKRKITMTNYNNVDGLREGLEACSEERAVQPTEGEDEFKPRRYSRVILYDDLIKELANGLPGADKTPFKAVSGFFSDNQIYYAIDAVASKNEKNLLYVNNLYGIVEDYVTQTGGDKVALKKAYDTEVSKLVNNRNEWLVQLYRLFRKIGDCDTILYNREIKLRNKIYSLEEEFLTQTYQRLSELNKLLKAGKKAEAQTLALEYNRDVMPKDRGLPSIFSDENENERYVERFVESADHYYFDYMKLGAMLRIARNLKKLSPTTDVTMPNFSTLAEFKTPSKEALTVSLEEGIDAQNTFVTEGMRKYITFVNAKATLNPKFKLEKLTVMTQLYKLGPVSPQGELDCTGENCLKVTAEEIIKESLAIAKSVDLNSDFDKKMVLWLNSSTNALYETELWTTVALERSNERHLGLLDLTFQRIVASSPVSLHDEVSPYFFGITKAYYLNELTVGEFFFKPRPRIKALIRENYTTLVHRFQTQADGFISTYERMRKDGSLEVITSVRRSLSDVIEVPMDADGLPVYLSQDRLNRYKSALDSFNEGTNGEFIKQTK